MRTETSCGGKTEKGMAVSMLCDLECLKVGCLSLFFFRYFFTLRASGQPKIPWGGVRNVVIDKNLRTIALYSAQNTSKTLVDTVFLRFYFKHM